jgi:hypothetical protein
MLHDISGLAQNIQSSILIRYQESFLEYKSRKEMYSTERFIAPFFDVHNNKFFQQTFY